MLRNIVAAAALVACTISPGAALAMPFDAGSLAKAAHGDDPIENVRIVCVNRYSGRIIAYHPCGYYRPRYTYYRRPRYRVFCKNRFTGRFIHWGYC